ncbi:coiled-coil domain-containing protein 22 homolog [Argonauta hians]
MEEVDKIIIHSLRTLKCVIGDDISNLQQFSTDLIVSATAKCLKAINNGLDLPNKLPAGMSARYRIGTALAHHIQELGYQGEIGYQTFLYSNENDIRKILIFLIEKVPKENVGTTDQTLDKSVILQRNIAAKIALQLKCAWTPGYMQRDSVQWRGDPKELIRQGVADISGFHACPLKWPVGASDLSKKIPKELHNYYVKQLPVVSKQPVRHRDTLASLLELNATQVTAQQELEIELSKAALTSRVSEQEYYEKKRQRIRKRLTDHIRQNIEHQNIGIDSQTSEDLKEVMKSIAASDVPKIKGSRFTHTEKLQFTKEDEKIAQISEAAVKPCEDSEEDQKLKREEEVQALNDELNECRSKTDQTDMEIKKFVAGKQKMAEESELMQRKNAEKEEKYHVKKRTLDLLPDAENNIKTLKSVVDNSAQRLVSLAKQWESHRAPLVDEYRTLKELNSLRESEAEKKLEEIKSFREKMKDIASETRSKEELRKQLVHEFEKMTKDVNRSSYTRRIIEIVSNIKKQNAEIDKILIDTKALQKEINFLTGKLDRTFAVTDELVFKDAKKDESVRKSYKHLAALHENCEALITTIQDTGGIMREIRDLEDQIDNECKKSIKTNMEKITADYQQMKKENSSLVAKLKEKS